VPPKQALSNATARDTRDSERASYRRRVPGCCANRADLIFGQLGASVTDAARSRFTPSALARTVLHVVGGSAGEKVRGVETRAIVAVVANILCLAQRPDVRFKRSAVRRHEPSHTVALGHQLAVASLDVS
jgi:hypothetical protein